MFRLSYLLEAGPITGSLMTYPEPGRDGGWFLLLAGLPVKAPHGDAVQKREVTIVLDRSGSMNGEKFEQAREAAKQIIAGLLNGEAFNLIVYNATVEQFAPGAVIKNRDTEKKARAYLDALHSGGGTNLHDALASALSPQPPAGMLPLVLFLTDGLPTVGNTSEIAIRKLALEANPHKRRIFTFGVGYDVNSHLLEKVAEASRARATFVLPGEDVEVKVGQVFKGLQGPVLTSPALAILDKDGQPAAGRVHDVLPGSLPDFFEGDQLVLLGRYTGSGPLTFRISGQYLGQKRQFDFVFAMDKPGKDTAYIARLWAERKIGELVDRIRQAGADMGSVRAAGGLPPTDDPRLKELMSQVVELSRRYGILTEYTAFLARKDTDLADGKAIKTLAEANFNSRALSVRSGVGGMNQSLNNDASKQRKWVNPRNRYWDANMNEVEVTTVQQVGDRAFYRREAAWVDSLVKNPREVLPHAIVVEFGSQGWHKLLEILKKKGLLSCFSLQGDILVTVDGTPYLIKRPTPDTRAAPAKKGQGK